MGMSPMEYVICLVPAAVVLVLAFFLVKAIREKSAKSADTISSEHGEEHPLLNNQSGSLVQVEKKGGNTALSNTLANQNNGLAITSIVIGGLALVIYVFLSAPWANCFGSVGFILGAIALIQIIKRDSKGKEIAIIGIILGVLPFIITLVSILMIALTNK